MAKEPSPFDGMRPVTQAELAEFIGISPPTVRAWTESGWLVKAGHGRYNVAENIQRLVGRVSKSRQAVDLDADVEHDEDKDPRFRKWRIEADLAEIKLQRARDEVIDAEDVDFVLTTIIAGARQVLLALPTTLLSRCPDLPPQAVTDVRDTVHHILTELSNTDVIKTINATDEDLEGVDSTT